MENQELEIMNNIEELNDEEAIGLFKNLQQIEDLRLIQNGIKENQIKVINDEDIINNINEKVNGKTVDDIKTMTDEDINGIYTINDEVITLGNNPDTELSFKRDFLIYNIESKKAMDELDNAINKIQEEMKSHEDEMKKLLQTFGDISTFLRQKLDKDLANAADDDTRNRIQKMIYYFDDALILDTIYNNCKKYSIQNTLRDYRDDKTAQVLYKKYSKVLTKLKIKTDLTNFNNLEINCRLPEKYHQYPNLFLFIVIKYFAHRSEPNRITDGILLTQLSTHVKSLYTDTFKDEETKNKFISSITRILDLYI
jgi:hypothetical protein